MSDAGPRKALYKISEVCQITETQPYVLRFWESEFPQLAPRKSRSGQRLYRQKDVELVLQIKRLLYEEGFTIAGARQRLGLGEGPGALDDLFEPALRQAEQEAAAEAPRLRESMVSSLTGKLRDLLKIMDQTDRRLRGKQ